MNIKFSLLITVYEGTKPEWLNQCLQSVVNQTLLPNQVVLVEDGNLPLGVQKVIEYHQKMLPLERARKKGPEGAGAAAAFGVKYCIHPWIARLDADDISVQERFALQVSYLKKNPKIDVLSGYLVEFNDFSNHPLRIRSLPSTHAEIIKMMKARCAINNTCVIFRKTCLEKAGGYDALNTHEDYLLWIKMLAQGCRFANLPKVLIRFRMDRAAIKRRQGFPAIKKEWQFQRILLQKGYVSWARFLINLLLRVPPRILPVSCLDFFYGVFLRKPVN